MFKSVLCPIDPVELGPEQQALANAKRLVAADGSVTLLAVIPETQSIVSEYLPADFRENQYRETSAALERCAGNSTSLSLDLFDQWQYMEKTTQWRYTPPTHVLVAFAAALEAFVTEGGQPARLARYSRNYETLVRGMAELGFRPFLDPCIQAPIIVTLNVSKVPCLRNDKAQLSAVCPPMVGSSASGRSFSMILATISGVSGSM